MNGTSWWGAIAVVSVLLTGCSASGTDATSEPEAGKHTMPNGEVMQDSEMHDHEESHDHGDSHDHGESHEQQAPAPAGPSPAARMVCTGNVVDDVTRILGLDTPPNPSSSWTQPMFTCTFALDGGPLVLSVHDATDRQSGRDHFETLRTRLGDTEELRGMYGLGLPAYETDDGTVAFIKDGKTLRVDATALPGRLGPERSMSQTDLAYAVATSVLACWTEHA